MTLKTPLAAIVGAAGALKELSPQLDDKAKADLVATILDESERLNRFIANLLDMTKLEAGSIKPNTAATMSARSWVRLERARKSSGAAHGGDRDSGRPADAPA